MRLAIQTEAELIGIADALGATKLGALSPGEASLLGAGTPPSPSLVRALLDRIQEGLDPLGEAFQSLRAPAERRLLGATYTPELLVSAMVALATRDPVARIIDPGSGSGKFAVAAGRASTEAELWAVEQDPLAALLCRAHLAAAGFGARARVVAQDYRSMELPSIDGPTLFLGNPPYVRHHQIDAQGKAWLTSRATSLGFQSSQLAGLHVHFFLATAHWARPGDRGLFVTAAEWLDVNYGRLLKDLLLGPLGLTSLDLLEPTSLPFTDALTTALVTGFSVGTAVPEVAVQRLASLSQMKTLGAGPGVPRARFTRGARWSPLTRPPEPSKAHLPSSPPPSERPLGELCRVHRGQVTGANRIWIAGEHSQQLPREFLFPCVTRARDLLAAGPNLQDGRVLRSVIDLPANLDSLAPPARERVDDFLKVARAMGGDQGFIANHRAAWWSVGLRTPAPILVTYMARRPPVFVRNQAGVRHINIAHGLYPKEDLSEPELLALVDFLNRSVSVNQGRTYAGGLTKFEPKELERLLVPRSI